MRRTLVIVLMALGLCSTTLPAQETARYAGRPLQQALQDLQARGLRIVYSSDLVRPDMIVRAEPRATELRAILAELLAEHGLEVRDGPAGSVLVVPEADAAGAGEIPGAERAPETVELPPIIVTPSRYTLLAEQPATHQFLGRTQLERLPHLSDDIFRVASRLPGATSGDFTAKFHVRGGETDEILVLVDGLEVYEPFHLKDFLSVFSVIDSRAIGGMDLMTGGFPIEYGDRMSGVMDITTSIAEGPTRADLGVSFVTAHAIGEGTFAEERGQWLVSARRGYLDIILNWVETDGTVEPVYYDLLGKVRYRLSPGVTVAGHFLAAYDDIGFESDDLLSHADATYGNTYGWLTLENQWSSRVASRTTLSLGHVDRERIGDDDEILEVQDERSFELVGLEQTWELDLGRHFLKAGLAGKRLDAEYDYRTVTDFSDPFPAGEEAGDVIERVEDAQPSGSVFGVYAGDRIRLTDPFTVELGIRWDRQTYADDDQVSPRVAAAYAFGSRTTARASWGLYHQAQRINELQVEDGVTDFFPAQRAEHRLLGVEHRFADDTRLQVEAYQKALTHLRPRFENLFDPIQLFPEAERDRVRIAPERGKGQGIELLLSRDVGGRFGWWVSYALASIEDRIEGRDVPRSWDQRHGLSYSLNYRAGRWNINLAGVHHSGWPTTPVTTVADPDNPGGVIPVLGERNSDRFAAFHRVDARVSRRVSLGSGALTFYFEVFNLLNRDNPCCAGEFVFRRQSNGSIGIIREEDYWLPRIPSFGVTWEIGG